MDKNEIQKLLQHTLTDNLVVIPYEEGFTVQLPFENYAGELIEVSIKPVDGQFVLDDMGCSAGLLFELAQHGEEAPGHHLVRSLANAYDITMDYDKGVLAKRVSSDDFATLILDFLKVLISIQTTIPEIKHRREVRGRRRLGSRLGRDIKQLQLPIRVQKQVEVEGKYDTWTVDYMYVKRNGSASVEILIDTADLTGRKPRDKVEHILTLAHDVLDIATRRELRIVYNLDGGESPAQRAAAMINDYQSRIGYKAYNYSEPKDKADLIGLTIQDLKPLVL